MRLFTAIELPEEARAAVAAEQKVVAATLRTGTYHLVRDEQIHLTLCFIGEVDAERATHIRTAMEEPVPLPPFTLAFGSTGVFPPRGSPRVLWLGVIEGEQQVVHLQREVGERLRAVGVELERRPFHPHLTLARWRDSRPSDRPREARRAVAVARMNVNAVTLFESRPSRAGFAYTVLARAPLNAGSTS